MYPGASAALLGILNKFLAAFAFAEFIYSTPSSTHSQLASPLFLYLFFEIRNNYGRH
jgi:hypothetical protein